VRLRREPQAVSPPAMVTVISRRTCSRAELVSLAAGAGLWRRKIGSLTPGPARFRGQLGRFRRLICACDTTREQVTGAYVPRRCRALEIGTNNPKIPAQRSLAMPALAATMAIAWQARQRRGEDAAIGP